MLTLLPQQRLGDAREERVELFIDKIIHTNFHVNDPRDADAVCTACAYSREECSATRDRTACGIAACAQCTSP